MCCKKIENTNVLLITLYYKHITSYIIAILLIFTMDLLERRAEYFFLSNATKDVLFAEHSECLSTIEKIEKEFTRLQFTCVDERELCDTLKLIRLETVEDSEEWKNLTNHIEMHDENISQIVTKCILHENELRKLNIRSIRIQIYIKKLEKLENPESRIPKTVTIITIMKSLLCIHIFACSALLILSFVSRKN